MASPPSSQRSAAEFAALYNAHVDHVRHLVTLFGVAERDADDVVQEVFFALHRMGDRLDTSTSLSGLLSTITYRIARDSRKRTNRERPERDSDIEVRADGQGWGKPADSPFTRVTMLELLGTLSDDLRTLFVMQVFGGMTSAEIANQLDMKEGTVKTRIRAAHQQLEAECERQRKREERIYGVGVLPFGLLSLDSLVENAQPVPSLSPSERASGWSRLVAALGPAIEPAAVAAAAGAVVATAPAAGIVFSAWQLAGLLVLTFALGGATVAALVAWHTPPPVAPMAITRENPSTVAAAAAATPPPSPSSVPPPHSTSAPSAAPPRVAALDAGLPVEHVDPSEERTLIEAAGTALTGEKPDPDAALRALARHQRNFPNSNSAAVRDALRAEALAAKQAQGRKPPAVDAGTP